MRSFFHVMGLICFAISSVHATHISVSSPDKRITFTFSDANQEAQYSVEYHGSDLILPSKLGFTFEQAQPLYHHFKVEEISRHSNDDKWKQPWGEQRIIRNHYNELVVKFTQINDANRHFSVRARVFDDGVGFRYEMPDAGDVAITRELTQFHLADSQRATAYWIPGQSQQRYEYLYRETALNEVGLAHTPFTVKYETGTHVAIHEAALVDYAGMSLHFLERGKLEAKLAPRSDGTLVHKSGSFHTPWRTITIGNEAVDLINSYIALNLNEPNKLGEVDWVNPGKYIGIWWGMHIGKFSWGAGEKHGATTERTIRYMNFAAKHGFDGVLVEGWNEGWDGNWIANSEIFSFTKSYPDFDIKKVTEHGKKIGVKLIGHHETSGGITNYEKQMESGFALYQKHGVEQIKTGYVSYGQNLKVVDENGVMRYEFTDSQPAVNHFINNVKTAAKYQLSINTHESVKDTGLRRTYPNWLARESARGQEYNAGWSKPNPAEHIPMLAYTRMLAGPMDFTPGIFNFNYTLGNNSGMDVGTKELRRPISTLSKQLAEYVVLYSPIQMAADLPENYEAKPAAFQFIKDVPTDWEETRALQGEVGDFVVVARKEKKHRSYNGRDWYLGAITNGEARTITVPLDFLEKGMAYEAQIYRDTHQTDWRKNPYAMIIEKKKVTRADTLNVRLAAAGGLAVRFKAL
ncbi:glycoside hydrolase family 97 protein [Alteromonas sp. ASW11-130]|uniref:glycoside hydrolase family 97 protein n=1 Tax=Alteromonas sp. ASW11-130 TaxID=3015775 RepID=UPI002241AE45|nr:glycoside hydrolase family 97 protein [Alteromonas sp. ASW11-130]MCW8091209.1 glycoside hydrolase family 97 protein [Alteromonas sp. ASW11-130]